MSIITKKEVEIIEKCCEIKKKKVELIKKLMPITTKKDVAIVEDKKIEDIKMSKSSRRLVLPKKILKVIARERSAKNYENLPKRELIIEINKLPPAKGPKKTGFEKIVFEKYPKKR